METQTLPHTLGPRIVAECALFIGLSQLSCSRDEVLEALYEAKLKAGWKHNWPYGMALVEAVWRRAYTGRSELADVKNMMQASALDTFARGAAQKWTSASPQVGAIGVLKNGSGTESTAFIVMDVMGDYLGTIETIGAGIRITSRSILYAPTTSWHLVGFINPPCYE